MSDAVSKGPWDGAWVHMVVRGDETEFATLSPQLDQFVMALVCGPLVREGPRDSLRRGEGGDLPVDRWRLAPRFTWWGGRLVPQQSFVVRMTGLIAKGKHGVDVARVVGGVHALTVPCRNELP